MSISLRCLILGENPDTFFNVNVSNTDYSSVLKHKIKEADRLDQVPTTKLELRVVNFPLDDLEAKLEGLKLDEYPTVSSYSKISSLNVAPSDDCLHILVIAPRSLKLLCVVEAEEMTWNNVFEVEIDIGKLVSDLKVAIKEFKKPALDHISANKLRLFKVSIPMNDDASDERLKVDHAPLKALLLPIPLSRLFPYVAEDHLHIIARVPIAERRAVKVQEEDEGRDHISSLRQRYENFVSLLLQETKSTESAKSSAYTENHIYDGRYQEDEPRARVAPPVQLFHPVFAHFLDDLKRTDDIPDDIIRATTKYMRTSSAIYANEAKRRAELTPLLCKILGVDIQPMMYDDETNVAVDLLMEVGGFLIFLSEHRNKGSLDPSRQAGLSMGRFWTRPKFKKLSFATNCPTFVVATAGPWIVILGAVFTDGFIVQRLTDYIWVGLDSVLTEAHISRVARVFYALKNGLKSLKSNYESVDLSDDALADYRYFPSINAYRIGEELVRFKYVGYLEDVPDCITLRARTLTVPPRDIVVKFVTRYGERAHRLLADNGLAPELLYYGSPRLTDKEPSYDLLSMVVMEFIDGQTLAKSKLNKEEAEKVKETLEDALTLLHANGLVFGDFRAPNVMITAAKELKIINFDWAGEEGQAKYPYLISPELPWPAGVQPLAIIERSHDLQMLKKMFSGVVSFIERS